MKQVLKVIPLMILTSVILVTGCSTPVEAPEIGKSAPNFQISYADGQSVSLSDFRGGKPVLLTFWTTWCPGCKLQMSYIQEGYEEWSERGLVVLTINIGESPGVVEEFMLGHSLTFPVILDMAGNVATQYNIRAIPTTYFIDSSGVIQDIKIGPFLSVAEIEDRLSRIAP